MSDQRFFGQGIAELASDPDSPIGQTIKKCPCLQALVDAINRHANDVELEEWIDNQVVMQMLHISSRTLQTLRSNGTLPYSRINSKIYYRRSDIERILNDSYKMAKIRWHHGKQGKQG